MSGRPRASRIATRLVAIGLVVLLASASVAAFIGGQVFLAIVGAIGGLLTAWALVSAWKAA